MRLYSLFWRREITILSTNVRYFSFRHLGCQDPLAQHTVGKTGLPSPCRRHHIQGLLVVGMNFYPFDLDRSIASMA